MEKKRNFKKVCLIKDLLPLFPFYLSLRFIISIYICSFTSRFDFTGDICKQHPGNVDEYAIRIRTKCNRIDSRNNAITIMCT